MAPGDRAWRLPAEWEPQDGIVLAWPHAGTDWVDHLDEVEECYMIAGGFDYLLKVRSRDMADYRRIMAESISALPHIHATTSYVAMEAVVEQNWTAI